MAKAKRIPAAVRQALVQGGHLPQAAEVVSHFMAAVGGPKGLVQRMIVEWDCARAGSLIRQRILDSILRMIGQANQDMGGLGDMDLLSSEDIERELQTTLGAMPDAEEETTSESQPPGPAGPGDEAKP